MKFSNRRGRPKLNKDSIDLGTPELNRNKNAILGINHESKPCQNTLDILCARGRISSDFMCTCKWITEIYYRSRLDIQVSPSKRSSHEAGWISGYYDGKGQEQNRDFSSKTKWFKIWEKIDDILSQTSAINKKLLIQSINHTWDASHSEIMAINTALSVIHEYLIKNLRR